MLVFYHLFVGTLKGLAPCSQRFIRIRIKIRLKLKNILLWTFFKTYYNLCYMYVIKYILQTRLRGIFSLFMTEKVNFIVATVMKT